MAFSPENSAVRVDAQLEKELEHAATHYTMMEALHAAALRQGLVVPDVFNSSVLLATPLAEHAPKRLAKTVVINGQKHILEGADQAELLAQENALYRDLMTEPAESAEPAPQPRNERGQFVSAEDAAAKAELELRFKRGEIDTLTYLSESRAIDQYLASQGISVEDLKQNAARNYEANWESATDTFLARHPEWVGGRENLQRMGETVLELGLQDSPRVDSLEAAYAELRRQNRIAENPELRAAQERHDQISRATNIEDIRTLARGSSLFGR